MSSDGTVREWDTHVGWNRVQKGPHIMERKHLKPASSLNRPIQEAIYVPQHNVTVLLRPPYSPDLEPTDYFLFPHMKNRLMARRFTKEEELEVATAQEVTK